MSGRVSEGCVGVVIGVGVRELFIDRKITPVLKCNFVHRLNLLIEYLVVFHVRIEFPDISHRREQTHFNVFQ